MKDVLLLRKWDCLQKNSLKQSGLPVVVKAKDITMKKRNIIGGFALALLVTLSIDANAQEKKESVGKKIDKTATKVGNKTAEVAVKGSSKVVDQTYKGKMAPDGTNVYIDGKNRKYYINKKGGKVYLKAAQIKDRPVVKP